MAEYQKIDATAVTFVVELVKVRAKMLETAAMVARDMSSDLYRSRVLDEIGDACDYVNSMLCGLSNSGNEE